MINLGGGDVHDFILSRTTVWRQRIAGETQAAEKIYEKYQSLLKDPLTYCVLQWDGKKIEYADGETHDRLCILLHTPPSGRSEFIGAPRTPNGTDTAQCEAILRYTDQWNVADRVIGMIWDTTASNTGRQKGSAILYEEALEHALLWITCRHHVSELHAHWADETVRVVHKGMLSSWQHYTAQLSVWCSYFLSVPQKLGIGIHLISWLLNHYAISLSTSTGPDDGLFARFKDHFGELDREDFHVWEWPQDLQSMKATQAALVLEWAEDHCVTGSFSRADYRELCEVLTVVLGDQVC